MCVLAALAACANEPGADPDASVPPPDAAVDAAAVVPCELPPMADGVSTLAGCADPGSGDGVRGAARFANPVNVLALPDGDVVVADFDNDLVRVVGPDGATRTLVDQPGFERPFGLARIGDTLYVSTDNDDHGQHSPTTGTIWRVDLAGGAATVVVRDVGRPRGLLALDDGRLVLADYAHHTVAVLALATATLAPLAGVVDQPGYADGRGAAARFDAPYGMARLTDGRIAVADQNNHRLRAIALDGTVTTLAGTGTLGAADGEAAAASFGFPQGLTVDGAGRLYVTDTAGFTIRRLAANEVTTLAGSGIGGWRDGALREAQFYGLEGIACGAGVLWVADGSRGEPLPYHRVRRVVLP
jgi:sugar lactone lactonase YvrE